MTQKVEAVQKPELFSLDNLNEVDACNHAEEMIYIDPRTEKETPWILMVLGYQADVLKNNVYKQLDREKRREFKAQKSGKVADPRPISDSVDDGYASIAACIVGWCGTEKQYTPALALNIITNNESVREQVKKFSDDLGNFGNSK